MEINITQKPPFQGKVFFLHFYMNLSHVALTSDGYDAAPGFNWLFSLNSSPQTFQHVGVSCQGPNNLDALFSDELSTTIFCLVLFVTPPPSSSTIYHKLFNYWHTEASHSLHVQRAYCDSTCVSFSADLLQPLNTKAQHCLNVQICCAGAI